MTQRTNLRKSVAFTMRLFMVAALMLFAGYHPAQAQPLDVKGTVVSAADGLPGNVQFFCQSDLGHAQILSFSGNLISHLIHIS